ncbi:hypothetical protein [Allorhodopirellula heiligendammensis]|uniref:Phage integrase family protein n=1 Tax=Allorhodopirellula heiligendammensis TaxID=2714739 RepID=A0A5C6C7Q7_9BACT|nr:hypothetical protein [Allorhodopirellula heiligendammensis]TWU19531.1 hypothetical protein Poly21_17050 [Allorhodopirellula heiligendammensis]
MSQATLTDKPRRTRQREATAEPTTKTDEQNASLATMQEYLDETFIPEAEQRGLSRDRIGEIRQAAHRWQWWSETKYRIARPLLVDVTARGLSEFRREVIGTEIPGRDGKIRKVSPRSLNKTLQAIEQIIAAAVDDGTLDDSRGLLRVKKVQQPEQIDKLIIPDAELSRIMEAAADAKWPRETVDGRPMSPGVMWQTAVVLFATYGMRTQDLIRYDSTMRPIRWGCVRGPGLSPAEDGVMECEHGWLSWVPNKTRRKKNFAMCLPLTPAARHQLDRWREAMKPADEAEPLMPVPMTRDKVYQQWREILSAAKAKPKPKLTFDEDGIPLSMDREYKIRHLRCTAATRADEHGAKLSHGSVGRWVTGHVSNDVFSRHYRGMERPIVETLTSLPMPAGFSPEPEPDRPRLRVVG